MILLACVVVGGVWLLIEAINIGLAGYIRYQHWRARRASLWQQPSAPRGPRRRRS